MLWGTIGQDAIAYSQQSSNDLGKLVFNSFNLSDCWELSWDTSNYDDMNKIDIDTYDAPRIDGGWVLGYFVRGKSLKFSLVVKKNTEQELNEFIDDFKLKLFKKEWYLRILVNGKYRQVKASLTSLEFNRDFEKPTYLTNVSLSFMAMENFKDETSTYWTETSVFSPTLSLDINNTGARTDWSLYFIFWAWVSNCDEITIQKDWYTLTINETMADWDILIVDWQTKQVLHNWVSIDYDWPFTQIDTWSNPILVSVNWTYIADITYLYFVNYL